MARIESVMAASGIWRLSMCQPHLLRWHGCNWRINGGGSNQRQPAALALLLSGWLLANPGSGIGGAAWHRHAAKLAKWRQPLSANSWRHIENMAKAKICGVAMLRQMFNVE